jgi:multidrug resistance efflux pump
MGLALGVLLGVICVAVLLWPFLRRDRDVVTESGDTPDTLQALRAQRDGALEEVRLLRLDHELGNVDEKEYQSRLEALRLRAATLLRREERLSAELQQREAALEQAVQARRNRRQSRNGAES